MASSARAGTQSHSDTAPFRTMRTDLAQTVQQVGHIVRDLMWHGLGQAIIEVLGEDMRVVADQSRPAIQPIHTRRPTAQIESYRNDRKGALVNSLSPGQTIGRRRNHETTLRVGNRFNERLSVTIHAHIMPWRRTNLSCRGIVCTSMRVSRIQFNFHGVHQRKPHHLLIRQTAPCYSSRAAHGLFKFWSTHESERTQTRPGPAGRWA